MKATAAVINAGLGDISLGLEMAGFKVTAAYGSDEKELATHGANMKIPIYLSSPEEIDTKSFPEVDLLAARIYCSPFSRAARAPYADGDPFLHGLLKVLAECRPRAFFWVLNASSAKNKRFGMLVEEVYQIGYQCVWQNIDVAQATGFPVREHTACIVGTLQNAIEPFQFSEYKLPMQILPDRFLQLKQAVDPWYFRIGPGDILQHGDEKPFYCWKNGAYVGADLVQWNNLKVPLVNIGDALRKITHREIAGLKGFPSWYTLPDDTNRQWLYKKLMYADNVLVIKQIAGMINYLLTDSPWRSQQAERRMRLEGLVGRYLANLSDGGAVEREPHVKDYTADFAFRRDNQILYFEVKNYNGSSVLTSKVKEVCKRLSPIKTDGLPILVLANEISDPLKVQCWEQFGVSIWDVGNLLWLFDKFPDIKNELIASLDYTIEGIEPKPPLPDVLQNVSEGKREEPSWKERLLRIAPGREQFQEYETICIEILKYVLGDSLTLWETQEPANNGLYRFDLCCKIKDGTYQGFFDIIQHYFNTKYIVFEFKNYSKKISQKEIYTTEKYLYEKALRKVAIIISRLGADEHALQAVRGSLRETGKLILCLSDNALLEMIDIKMRGEQDPAEFLGALLDDLLIHLEK